MRLARDVPAIRARMGENVAVACGVMSQALAERDGRAADDLEIRIVVAALLAAWSEAIITWVAEQPHQDLADLLDRTPGLLSANFSDRPAG
ncbi:acyl-CoA-like ligand-binding transcription factor [Actinacidiphila soli]|uniref:acyl-CoA-like ligand-binding transcription factor n=1 Tax=Actinacidiphila soli TaxID=2487275 RepID=UPI000FCC73F9|nr:hypothetical protein [Actinacidiphila soli]